MSNKKRAPCETKTRRKKKVEKNSNEQWIFCHRLCTPHEFSEKLIVSSYKSLITRRAVVYPWKKEEAFPESKEIIHRETKEMRLAIKAYFILLLK